MRTPGSSQQFETMLERSGEFPRRLKPILHERHEKPLIVVECDAKGTDIEPVLVAARQFADAGVDGVSVSDNALARLRICSVALSHLIQEVAGVRAICHKTCRDTNLLGMHSLLLGASRLRVNTILAITGDKMALGEFERHARGVFDLNSIRLVELLSSLNKGRTLLGREVPGPAADFEIGVGFNPNVSSLSDEIERLGQKIAVGAHFALSQLVFDPDVLSQMYRSTHHLNIPILLGIAPLVSLKNARFINDKIMHGQMPAAILGRMAAVEGDRSAEALTGLAISKEHISLALSLGASGFYLVTPLGRTDMVLELVNHIKEEYSKGNWRNRIQSRAGGLRLRVEAA